MYKYEVSSFKGNNQYDYNYGNPKRKEELKDMIKNLKEARHESKEKSNNNRR